MAERDPRVGHLPRPALPAQLTDGLDEREHPVHAAVGVGEAPAVGVHREFPAGRGALPRDEGPALARPAEAERLEPHDRHDREGIVELRDVDVGGRHARHLEGALARQPGRVPAREVGHLAHHDVGRRLARAEHVDGLPPAVARPLGAGDHDRAARVGDEAAVEQAERPGDEAGGEHLVDRERIPHERAGVEGRPLARRDGDLGELLAGGPELVHVARGGERVAGGRPGEAEGYLELEPKRVRAEARAWHANAGCAAFSVGDERHLAHAGGVRHHRVLHVGDERAPADLGTVDVAGPDAQVLRGFRAHPKPGAEDRVDIVLPEARVGQRVPRCLGVELEGRLVRQLAVLVRLGRAHDRNPTPHPAALRAHVRKRSLRGGSAAARCPASRRRRPPRPACRSGCARGRPRCRPGWS